jgi:hypothetical protein
MMLIGFGGLGFWAAWSGETPAGLERISRGRDGVSQAKHALAGDCAMSNAQSNRRAAIAACSVFVLTTAMRGGAALAQSRPAVSAIRVDVAPLRAASGDPTATWVEQELPRQLTGALSGRLTPKGATLIVRVDSLTLGPNKDSWAWDNISGVLTIGGLERPVRATSRYWASAIDAATIAQSNHARVSAAAQALAFWIARNL